jgi:hypothetical protein
MELCSPELECFVLLYRLQILISVLELGKPVVCMLTKNRTGRSMNNGSIPDSGNIYFPYLNFPDSLWEKLQSI